MVKPNEIKHDASTSNVKQPRPEETDLQNTVKPNVKREASTSNANRSGTDLEKPVPIDPIEMDNESTNPTQDENNPDLELQREKAEDISSKRLAMKSFWKFYLAWWIRIPFGLVIAYYCFLIAGNITTWQENRTSLFDLRNWDPQRYGDPAAPKKPGTNLILPDLGFMIATVQDQAQSRYLSTAPALPVGLMILFCLYQRNMILVAEAAWIETVMEILNAAAMVVTTLPDPYGFQKACLNPQYKEWGIWIFKRVNFDFCGNLMWSGHTYHTLLGMHILWRGFRLLKSSPFPKICSLQTFKFCYWLIAIPYFLALIFMLIFSKFHYTADVLIAIFMSALLMTHRLFIHRGVKFYFPPSKDLTFQDMEAMRQEKCGTTPSSKWLFFRPNP